MDEEREETEESSEEIMMSVSDLGPRSRKVNVKVKVVELNEAREVTSRKDGSVNRVTEALVGDDTGVIFLTLWNDDIDRVSVDSALKISNGYCNVFKNSLRLNIGRYGSIEETEEDITANTENNLISQQIQRIIFQKGFLSSLLDLDAVAAVVDHAVAAVATADTAVAAAAIAAADTTDDEDINI